MEDNIGKSIDESMAAFRKCIRGSYHLNLIRKPPPPTRYSSDGAIEMVPDSKTGGSHGGPPVYKFIMKPAGPDDTQRN